MSYRSLALSYNPIDYWDISQGVGTDASSVSARMLGKTSTTNSNRSLYYGEDTTGSMLVNSASNIAAPLTNILSSSSSQSSFTICFWYQHLSDLVSNNSSSSPFLSTETSGGASSDIKMTFFKGSVKLVFCGTEIVCPFDSAADWEKPTLISISYSYPNSTATLTVGSKSVTKSVSASFSANTQIRFSTISGIHYQVSGLAMYKFYLDKSHMSSLMNSNNYSDDYNTFNYYYDPHSIIESIPNRNKIGSYGIEKDNTYLYNCQLNGSKISLVYKNMAAWIGTPSHSSTGITVGASSGLRIPVSDIETSNCSIKISVDKLNSGSSGTLLYLEGPSSISIVLSGGNILVYSASDLKSTIATSSLISDIEIQIIAGIVWINYNGVSTNTGIPYSYSSYGIIGNNSSLDSNFTNSNASYKKIKSFTINYIDYPLSVGKYKLDFNHDYGTATSIKPVQDARAFWLVPAKSGSVRSTVNYSNTGNSIVKTFITPVGTWLDGSKGTQVLNGTAALSGSNEITTSTSSELIYIYSYLYDDEVSSNTMPYDPPSIENLSITTLSSMDIYSENSSLKITSSDNKTIRYGIASTINPKREVDLIKVNNNNTFSITGIQSDRRELSMRLRLDKTSVTSGSVVFKTSGGSTIGTVTITRSGLTYTIAASGSGMSGVYIDGVVNGSPTPTTLDIYNDYIINIVLSATFATVQLTNMSDFSINDISLFDTSISTKRVMQSNISRYTPRASTTADALVITDSAPNLYTFVGISTQS